MEKTISAVMLGFTLLIAGCFENPPGGGDDLGTASPRDFSTPGDHDLANGGGNHDLAGSPPSDLSSSSPNDLAGGALLPLCATCVNNTDCATGLCVPYMMGATMKCSHSCSTATATTDCPGVNACNGMSYCKCQ